MKKKLMVLTLAMVLGLAFAGPQCAVSADLLWANTTIDRVLQTAAAAQVRLTDVDGVFTSKLFNISNDRQNAMLAILLTAMSLDKQVRVAFYDGNPATIILVGTIQQ
jgi:hypothetical protein